MCDRREEVRRSALGAAHLTPIPEGSNIAERESVLRKRGEQVVL